MKDEVFGEFESILRGGGDAAGDARDGGGASSAGGGRGRGLLARRCHWEAEVVWLLLDLLLVARIIQLWTVTINP